MLASSALAAGYPGVAVAVTQHGRAMCKVRVGWQDPQRQIALAPNTLFRIYSMTKPVIALAVLLLHQQGRLRLDDPVVRWLPKFGSHGVQRLDGSMEALERPATVLDLLRHTSGLSYDFLEDHPVSQRYREAGLMRDASRSLQDMVDCLLEMPLAWQPATRWHYSLGLDVAAHVIEKVTQMPLIEFLKQSIFEPLNMSDTVFCLTQAQQKRLCVMHGNPDICRHTLSQIIGAASVGPRGLLNVDGTCPVDQAGFARGGHGLVSCIDDIERLAQALLTGQAAEGRPLLHGASVALLHKNHLLKHCQPVNIGGVVTLAGYGFGLGMRHHLNPAESQLPSAAGEFGWSGAARTFFWVDPVHHLTGVVMTQYMNALITPELDVMKLVYAGLV